MIDDLKQRNMLSSIILSIVLEVFCMWFQASIDKILTREYILLKKKERKC